MEIRLKFSSVGTGLEGNGDWVEGFELWGLGFGLSRALGFRVYGGSGL